MGFFYKLFSGDKKPEPKIENSTATLEGKTIACVESSQTIQRIMELTVAQTGASWLPFSSTQEFLAGASSSKPDVAIVSASDLGADIGPILGQIKSEIAGIRIVLLTDLSHDVDVAKASQLGADAAIRKPFNADELLASVTRLTQ